jgi:hypothetical protein
MGEKRKAYRLLVGKRPLGRPSHNLAHLAEINGVDWVDLAQDKDKWRAVVNVIMNLRVP